MDTLIERPTSTTAPAGRTNALTLDEVVTEARRRVELYRTTKAADYPARAEAVEAFLHWLEASR